MKDFLEPELRIIVFKTEDILFNGDSQWVVIPEETEDGDLPIMPG